MNASLLLLSSAWIAAADPIVVSGAGCSGCGASVAASPTFASVSFGAAACGSCGTTARVSLFDRIRAKFSSAGSCGTCGASNFCGLTTNPAAACGTPCGSPLRSSFVPSYTAYAAPVCPPTLLRSSFPVASASCCDFAPTPRVGLLARIRSRLCGTSSSSCATGCETSGCATGGCTSSYGTVVGAPISSGCVSSLGTVVPPSTVPPANPPVTMPKPPVDKPKDTPKDAPKPKETPKDKTSIEAAPVVPLVPSDLPRIPTLGGN